VAGVQLTAGSASAPGFRPIGFRDFRINVVNGTISQTDSSFTSVYINSADPGCNRYTYSAGPLGSNMDIVCPDARVRHFGATRTVGTWSINAKQGCGDERDTIIAEYKKSYGKDALGKPLRVFDINLDPDGTKNSVNPSAYFVPTCEMFTGRLRTVHYSFEQLKNGDGGCSPRHSWALVANALADTTASGRGLDRWAELIRADRFVYNGITIVQSGYPKLNSGYRSPARQLSACVGSTAYGSRHMFGDAVDLAITGADDTIRRVIAMRWYSIGKMKAGVDWVESADGYPCSTKPPAGQRWRCAHGDWRSDADAFGPSALSRTRMFAIAAVAATATTFAQGDPPSAASAEYIKQARQLSLSSDSSDRAKALGMLKIPYDAATSYKTAGGSRVSAIGTEEKNILVNILRGQLEMNTDGSEEEDDFLYRVVQISSIYAPDESVELLLSANVVPRGRDAWKAAARTGDVGVPLLLNKLADRRDELYGDYLGVACMMREIDTVHDERNENAIDKQIAIAAKDQDWLYRSFAAECLKWTSRKLAEPILRGLQARDSNKFVREEAIRTLEILRSGKSASEMRVETP
jgi:hypothetical protein